MVILSGRGIISNRGFSFIVIVVVLFFVGMITGGIILARHLMNSADAIKLIAQVSKYESATILFHENYKEYPADSSAFVPHGDENGKLDDQLGRCARAPNEKLINDERYQFWAHLSQSRLLGDEKYEPYSPPLCGGNHSENWAAPELAGILWPYVELEEKASAILQTNKAQFLADIDTIRKQVYFTFYVNATDATAFAHKFAKEAHAANEVDLVNQYGEGNCKTLGLDDDGVKIDEFVNCRDKNAAIAKFVYFVKEN